MHLHTSSTGSEACVQPFGQISCARSVVYSPLSARARHPLCRLWGLNQPIDVCDGDHIIFKLNVDREIQSIHLLCGLLLCRGQSVLQWITSCMLPFAGTFCRYLLQVACAGSILH